MTESYIETNKSGACVAIVGPDAVALARAVSLKGGIKLYRECGMLLTRGMGIKMLLSMAGDVTGKKYSGKKDYERAENDLQEWVNAMKAAMPYIQRE